MDDVSTDISTTRICFDFKQDLFLITDPKAQNTFFGIFGPQDRQQTRKKEWESAQNTPLHQTTQEMWADSQS